jgi:hypothetical protein
MRFLSQLTRKGKLSPIRIWVESLILENQRQSNKQKKLISELGAPAFESPVHRAA